MSILKPTNRWRADIGEDTDFTEEAITETERILDQFQQRLTEKDKTQESILLEVKHVILELNKLDNVHGTGKFPNLICTMERDELAEFIETCAKSAGLTVTPGVDITEAWREW